MLSDLSRQLAIVTWVGLVCTAVLTGPLSLVLLALYRRAVQRGMRREAGGPGTTFPAETLDGPSPRSATSATLAVVTSASQPGWNPEGKSLYDEASRRQGRTARTHAFAGAAYGAASFAGAIWLLPDRLTAVGVLAVLLASAFPGLLAWTSVKEPGRQGWLLWAGYFATLVVLMDRPLSVDAAPASAVASAQGVDVYLAMLILGYPVLLAVRGCGAVGQVVLAFVGALVFGYGAVVVLLASHFGLLMPFHDLNQRVAAEVGAVGRWHGLAARAGVGPETLKVLVLLGSLAFFLVPGAFAIRWLGRRYRANKLSDQSLTTGASYLTCTILTIGALGAAPLGPFWGIVPLAACALTLAVGSPPSAAVAPGPWPAPPRLLLLRVFSLGGRRRRVFRRVERFWRHIGPIRLISGPDLALSTVEPHEVIDFLTLRLNRHFIRAERLGSLRSREDERRDRDGRYRVEEYFCHADVWQRAFAELAASADVVAMDVRGFEARHAGCSFELEQLLGLVPPAAVVLLIDRRTDRGLLEGLLARSVRRGARGAPEVTALVCGLRTDWRRLFQLLCNAAAMSRAARERPSAA